MGQKHKIDYRYKTYKMSSPRILAQRPSSERRPERRGSITILPSAPVLRRESPRFEQPAKCIKVVSRTKANSNVKPPSSTKYSRAIGKKPTVNQQHTIRTIRPQSRPARRPRFEANRQMVVRATARIARAVTKSRSENTCKNYIPPKSAYISPIVRPKPPDRSPSPLFNLLFPHNYANLHRFNVTPLRLTYPFGFNSLSPSLGREPDDVPGNNNQSRIDLCPRCLTPSLKLACNLALSAQPEAMPEESLKEADVTSRACMRARPDSHRVSESVSCQAPPERDQYQSKAVQVSSMSLDHQVSSKGQKTNTAIQADLQHMSHWGIKTQKSSGHEKPSVIKYGRAMTPKLDLHGGQRDGPHRDIKQTARRQHSLDPRPYQRAFSLGTADDGELLAKRLRLGTRAFDTHHHSLSPTKKQTPKRGSEKDRPGRCPSFQPVPTRSMDSRSPSSDPLSPQDSNSVNQNKCEQACQIRSAPTSLWKSIASAFVNVLKPLLNATSMPSHSRRYPSDRWCDCPGSPVDATSEKIYVRPSSTPTPRTVHDFIDLLNGSKTSDLAKSTRSFVMGSPIYGDDNSNVKLVSSNVQQKSMPIAMANDRARISTGRVGKLDSFMHSFAQVRKCVTDLATKSATRRQPHSRNSVVNKFPSTFDTESQEPAMCESLSEEIFGTAQRVHPFSYNVEPKLIMSKLYQGGGPHTGSRSPSTLTNSYHHYADHRLVQKQDTKSKVTPMRRFTPTNFAPGETFTLRSPESVPNRLPRHAYNQGRPARPAFHGARPYSKKLPGSQRGSPSPSRGRRPSKKRASSLSSSRADSLSVDRWRNHPSRRGYQRLLSCAGSDSPGLTSDKDTSYFSSESKDFPTGAVDRLGIARAGTSYAIRSGDRHWRL